MPEFVSEFGMIVQCVKANKPHTPLAKMCKKWGIENQGRTQKGGN